MALTHSTRLNLIEGGKTLHKQDKNSSKSKKCVEMLLLLLRRQEYSTETAALAGDGNERSLCVQLGPMTGGVLMRVRGEDTRRQSLTDTCSLKKGEIQSSISCDSVAH